ncbi:MAG: EAL domain-containing protein [Hyphomicrobiaceae bacterium]|nr:EAL domain-containing protein [Hyphomicrobiaceae bacterium]
MYAIAIACIAGFAAIAAYVAYVAIQTRADIQSLEEFSLQQVAITSQLDDLERTQQGLILSFFLTPNHTFSKADFRRLGELTARMQEVDAAATGPASVAQEDFETLKALAAELLDDSISKPDKLATLHAFLKTSASVERQLHVAASKRALEARENLKQISTMGDNLAWSVALASAVLICFVIPIMVLTITRFVRRINHITRTMHRIADCETGVDVPSTVDIGEVGELARAVQAFKRNTIALQRNSTEMLRLNGWFDLALNNMHGGLSIFDQNQELVMCNERYLELYDLPKHLGRPGTHLRDIVEYWYDKTSAEGSGRTETEVEKELNIYRANVADQQESVRVITLPSGRTVLVSSRPSLDGGWVDVHDDVTDRIQSDKTIERLAHSDLLTGLMNRHNFMTTLGARLGDIGQSPELAVLLVDICDFKRVNDTYGHDAGDAVLKTVAERLAALAGSHDNLGRLGGDGFALLKAGLNAAGAETCARDMCAVANEPVVIDGESIEIRINVGVALAPDNGQTAGELLQRAELALVQSKTAGPGTFALFDPQLESNLRENQALKDDLKAAFDLGQFELHYQPIMDFKTRQVASVEALMRWHHPTRGMVPPGIFIPIAEETGLIEQLGKWAIGRACRDAISWPDHVRVAVNLSANQFRNGDLHTITHAALRESGLPARRLEFEVTESLLLADEERTRRTLNRLKIMGIRIALDDFGTGYASLSYLRSFPFDKIKIDQTFVRDLPRDSDCNAIVRSVVLLAQMLGMRTVAEGIETVDHLNQVVAAGCDEIQGYYLSRPVPAASVPGIIADCENRLAEAA